MTGQRAGSAIPIAGLIAAISVHTVAARALAVSGTGGADLLLRYTVGTAAEVANRTIVIATT